MTIQDTILFNTNSLVQGETVFLFFPRLERKQRTLLTLYTSGCLYIGRPWIILTSLIVLFGQWDLTSLFLPLGPFYLMRLF